MYYGGSPSYSSAPYSYSSSISPLGSSFSASYLNPGGSYSNHSSLIGYSRTPLTTRWTTSSGRNYSPILSTISERGTSSPVRIHSPRGTTISKRTYGSHSYTPRPININTADIDVSRDKYRRKVESPAATSTPPQRQSPKIEKENGPFMPRVDGKPETGIDSSPGSQRNTIKRGRTVVRLHTLKRKERDSPRKPVEETETKSTNDKQEEDGIETLGWREKLSDDLVYKDKREKKTLGEKLVEKFIVKDKNDSETETSTKETKEKEQNDEDNISLSTPATAPPMSKSPDRRCSMELLAEQASLLDSLIRGENLSTVPVQTCKDGLSHEFDNNLKSITKRRKSNDQENPLQTTKSDQSLYDRLSSIKDFRDSKHFSKRRSIKRSSSSSSICRLDSITEFPKEPINIDLPAIEESRQSLKSGNIKSKVKPKLKPKITSSVEVTAPTCSLKFKVEDVTVEEKPRMPKKEIIYSSEVDEVLKDNENSSNTENVTNTPRNSKMRYSTRKRTKILVDSDALSPESENCNFWDTIGKRETVYLISRKQTLEEAKERNRRALLWFPEEESGKNKDINVAEDGYQTENMATNCDSFENVSEDNLKDLKDSDTINFADSATTKCDGSEDISEDKHEILSSGKQNAITRSVSFAMMPEYEPDAPNSYKPTEICTSNEESSTTCSDKIINEEHEENFSKDNIVNTNIDNEIKTYSSSLKDDSVNERNKDSTKMKKSSKKQKSDASTTVNNNMSVNTEPTVSTAKSNDNIYKSPENVVHVETCGSDKRVKSDIAKESSNEFIKANVGKKNDEVVPTTNKSSTSEGKDTHRNIPSDSNIDEQKETIAHSVEKKLESLSDQPENNKEDIFDNDDIVTVQKNTLPPVILSDVPDSFAVTETENIPNEETKIKTEQSTLQDQNTGETEKSENVSKTQQTQNNELTNDKDAVAPKDIIKLPHSRKPPKDEPALKPLIATPRPLQKRVPQVIHSSSSSDTSSDGDSSSDDDADESDTSEDSAEFFECENNPDGRTSTGSNDSGFDSSAPTSPSGFFNIKKGGEASGTSNLTPEQTKDSIISEHQLEQSTAYGLFRKTGRFTPPARSIPRFRKYGIDDFHFIKVLGKGSFGKVLLAELRKTEYYYAVKCLKKDVVLEDDDVECTLIERKVLALGTNHPYLCHLFATFQTDSHLFFVMEYLNGGDLMFHIQQSGRFPEVRARFYAAEIVSGLKFLHKRGIVYRDLKLDNILLDFEGHVRIADFGMCKLQIYLEKTADTFCGTPDYMAPEIIKGLKYNQAVDWWSFGVLLYEMLIGQSPFSGCDEDELFWSICNEMPSYPRFLSQEALSILTRLLDKDAQTRLGGTECMHGDIRDQDFFHQIPWDRLERRELEAPFKPRVRHPMDTQYFDRAFTGERPRLTAVEPQVLRSMDQEPFRGFSYTNPNATDR